jgi:hypothetical protein
MPSLSEWFSAGGGESITACTSRSAKATGTRARAVSRALRRRFGLHGALRARVPLPFERSTSAESAPSACLQHSSHGSRGYRIRVRLSRKSGVVRRV